MSGGMDYTPFHSVWVIDALKDCSDNRLHLSFNISHQIEHLFLSRMVRRGYLTRIKKGGFDWYKITFKGMWKLYNSFGR